MTYLPLQVDITGWMISRLIPVLAPVRVASETPADPQGTLAWLPMVTVERAGGPNDNVIIDQPTLELHCFAATWQGANQLGYAVIGAVRGLRGLAGGGAILTIAGTLSGPTRAPTENPNLRHAVVLMQPRIKTTG